MKKNFLWTMAAAVTLMGCTADDLTNGNAQVSEDNAIAFSTYVNKTRASVVNTDYIKLHGFGVSTYYTKDATFAEATADGFDGTFDTFMDNTKVYFDNEKNTWTYSPIKYWPNNVGDQLSFFAYAPYKSEQIVFTDENNRSTLEFTVNNEVKKQVDLIYHKAAGDNNIGVEKTIDRIKPTISSTITFNFLHALSRVAFDVKAVVDDTNTDSDNLLDGNTHININKLVLITGDEDYEYDETNIVGPFYTVGSLNILNGEWTVTDEQKKAVQSFVFDGDEFYRAVDVNGTADVESDDVVQLTKFNPAQRLLNEDSYLMIIPQDFTGSKGYRIYIEYDVISESVDNNGTDENTTSDNSTISHKIYSEPMKTNFVAGQAYIFNIRLGMTSAKFDASVTEWPAEEDADEDDETWTPENNN